MPAPQPPSNLVRRLLLLVAFAVTIAAPATAQAKPKAMWTTAGDPARPPQIAAFKALDVTLLQSSLRWSDIATTKPAHPRDPSDPAYAWPAGLDEQIAQARQQGIGFGLMILSAPKWSNGGRRPQAPPKKAKDYADFAVAAARRYPSVHLWMVWGEPIRSANYLVHKSGPGPNLLSTKKETLRPYNAQQRADTRHYAELVDATYGALKKRSRANKIVGGMTTTVGDVDPVNWIKNMKLKNGKPPRMDMYGHNPFSTRRPALAKPQIQPGALDFSDLDTLATLLDRYQARDGRNRKLPIFISEYSIPTDHSGFEFPFWVDRPVAADWLRSAFAIVDRDPRIYDMAWFSLDDFVPRASDGQGSPVGLIDEQGNQKPAYDVFKSGS